MSMTARLVQPLHQKRVSILGSTGSIGQSTLDVISQHPEQYPIAALTAQNNVEKLIEQARTFHPAMVAIGEEKHYQTLKDELSDLNIEVVAGKDAHIDAASRPADWVMAAIVGSAGLEPTLKAIEQGSQLAFANKECLVCAGELMMQHCKQSGATLLPVDSEHNAIFQVLNTEHHSHIDKITLTASGGPFRGKTLDELKDVTKEQAIAHPKWDMGAKISIDSATLMNKGLELIEAYHLFPVTESQLDIIVHPESIIHSLVHYKDGSTLAQLGMPDMRIPISYTLAWPHRLELNTPKLDLAECASMHFEKPDAETFKSLNLCRDALKSGQSACIVLNAANEIAVERFMNDEISFLQISDLIEKLLAAHNPQPISTVEDVIALDHDTRTKAKEVTFT
ncbi:MAG: 1-deoxy-D-xylulose-5-phosphate reductoisomerase [Rickettsiales bacterium]|nr:1-deoxy-D-xylulose-5-phosphate reductoisomerase [Rickettsiales bacterium]